MSLVDGSNARHASRIAGTASDIHTIFHCTYTNVEPGNMVYIGEFGLWWRRLRRRRRRCRQAGRPVYLSCFHQVSFFSRFWIYVLLYRRSYALSICPKYTDHVSEWVRVCVLAFATALHVTHPLCTVYTHKQLNSTMAVACYFCCFCCSHCHCHCYYIVNAPSNSIHFISISMHVIGDAVSLLESAETTHQTRQECALSALYIEYAHRCTL